jgi:hypothetical protein
LLKEYFLHPNGQIPAYEWSFGDVNPPVLAMAALKTFRADRVQRGASDIGFLQRVLNKLLLNYAWWLNRKDADGHGVFEGGFLGLDNISVYDRSQPLPHGYALKQADATGWMAMFALNMTVMALELAAEDSDYEDIAIQCHQQFMGIANTIAGRSDPHGHGLSLWDPDDGFFKDLVVAPDGSSQRIDVFSWVGHHSALRVRDRRPAPPRQRPALCRDAIEVRRRAVRRSRYLRVSRAPQRARRVPAFARRLDDVVADPSPPAVRERIPVALRHPRCLARARRAQGPGRDPWRRPGDDRIPAGRIEFAALRRQLQLARPDLDADQLHADPGD